MADKVRMTRFDMWFFRAMWIGLLGMLVGLIAYITVIASSIGAEFAEGAARKVGMLIALQAVLVATTVWAAMRTARQWRALVDRVAADAPHVATERHRTIGWLRRTWRETDPTDGLAPPPLPDDDRLRAVGLGDDDIKRLRANPQAFSHTLWVCSRVRGKGFSGGVRGKGFAERTVGAAHYLWSRLA